MKVGLYSITYLGLWYGGRALTLEEVIERARNFGYEGVEIDGKRPHGSPLDLSRERCRELRAHALGAGIELYAVAANNDFSSPVPEHRESQLLYVRDLICMASDLGSPIVRVFAAWPGVTRAEEAATYAIARRMWSDAHVDVDPQQTWDWCRDGLREAAKWAGDAGVALALQNHPPVTNTPADMLRMIREVDSPHLKACLDAPLAARQGITSMQHAAQDVRGLQMLSHFGGEYELKADGTVCGLVRNPDGTLAPEHYYLDFAAGMQQIGYDGYIGYELCHPLPKIDGRTVGLEFADENARLAARYMRGVLDRVPQAETA
jgi:sugar phosphate isomerase/epimerase